MSIEEKEFLRSLFNLEEWAFKVLYYKINSLKTIHNLICSNSGNESVVQDILRSTIVDELVNKRAHT